MKSWEVGRCRGWWGWMEDITTCCGDIEKNGWNLNTHAIFDGIEGRKERWRMISGEKLVDDAIEVLEGEHEDCDTLSEKFGHSKEIVRKSGIIEGKFLMLVRLTPYR